jgi:signal transduction histidine kinase
MHRMKFLAFASLASWLAIGSPALADPPESATPEEVVTKVLEAVQYLNETGKAGYSEFNSASERWMWKDSYVFIYNCAKNEMVAHPLRPDLVGRPLLQIRDTNNKPIFKELCAAGAKPRGGWVEYAWPKPGEGGVSRKISYAHAADISFEFGVQVGAGIYNNEASVEELTKLLDTMFDPERYPAL